MNSNINSDSSDQDIPTGRIENDSNNNNQDINIDMDDDDMLITTPQWPSSELQSPSSSSTSYNRKNENGEDDDEKWACNNPWDEVKK